MKKRIVIFGGCGTVGQRVRDAISRQDDMEVFAVVTRSAKENVLIPHYNGIKVYTSSPNELERFKQLGISDIGTLDDLFKYKNSFDVIIDCTDDGFGKKNLENYYRSNGFKVIFQGGEKADIAEASFSALSNYEEAAGKNYIRVVSCNTTGSSRLLKILDDNYNILMAYGYLERRGNDPHQESKLPRGSQTTIEVDSHQGKDITTVLKNLKGKIRTDAKKVDKQEFHSHYWTIDLEKKPSLDEIKCLLKNSTRIITLSDKFMFKDDGKIKFYMRDRARTNGGTGDVYETIVWPEEFIRVDKSLYPVDKVHQEGKEHYEIEELYVCKEGTKVSLQILVDQQCIVVPETVDAVRAMFNMASKQESIEKTNKSLGIKQEVRI